MSLLGLNFNTDISGGSQRNLNQKLRNSLPSFPRGIRHPVKYVYNGNGKNIWAQNGDRPEKVTMPPSPMRPEVLQRMLAWRKPVAPAGLDSTAFEIQNYAEVTGNFARWCKVLNPVSVAYKTGHVLWLDDGGDENGGDIWRGPGHGTIAIEISNQASPSYAHTAAIPAGFPGAGTVLPSGRWGNVDVYGQTAANIASRLKNAINSLYGQYMTDLNADVVMFTGQSVEDGIIIRNNTMGWRGNTRVAGNSVDGVLLMDAMFTTIPSLGTSLYFYNGFAFGQDAFGMVPVRWGLSRGIMAATALQDFDGGNGHGRDAPS